MTKTFVELKYKRKAYKLRIDEIKKVYRTVHRNTPVLPSWDVSNKESY